MTLHDDAVGYIACFVAVIFFGSNFVPVKRVATADGMFFSLIMTSAVLLEGCVVQLWRGSPKFEPFAMLGGVIWYVETSLGRRPGVIAESPDSYPREFPLRVPSPPVDHVRVTSSRGTKPWHASVLYGFFSSRQKCV